MVDKKYPSITLRATLYWAALDRVNELSGKFQVDLGQLSDAVVEQLRTMGLDARVCDKEENNRGHYITAKSSIKAEEYRRSENDLRWFSVTTADRGPVDLSKIGNGTTAHVRIDAIPYTFKKKEGISCGLNKIVITHLVEYEGGEDDDELYEQAQADTESDEVPF